MKKIVHLQRLSGRQGFSDSQYARYLQRRDTGVERHSNSESSLPRRLLCRRISLYAGSRSATQFDETDYFNTISRTFFMEEPLTKHSDYHGSIRLSKTRGTILFFTASVYARQYPV